MPDKKITIAIDGPAGSGKSTTAKILADKLGYIHVDTGAMYRAITHQWLQLGFDLTEENMMKLLSSIDLDIRHSQGGQKTYLNGTDVGDDIRRPEVDRNVSEVAAVACVRQFLVEMQRKLGEDGGAVLDGRDIGTVVVPDAELKIFLIASVDSRAVRRKKQHELKGQYLSLDEIRQQIEDRDHFDSTREISPLRKAKDAVEIDTSSITIEEQVATIYDLATQKIASLKGT